MTEPDMRAECCQEAGKEAAQEGVVSLGVWMNIVVGLIKGPIGDDCGCSLEFRPGL